MVVADHACDLLGHPQLPPSRWTSVLVTASAQSGAVNAWIRYIWTFGTEK
jgi:hypothetical protein